MLMALILAVCLSPRIRLDLLPTENVDIRVQDLLLPIGLAILVLAPRGHGRLRWWATWGPWLPAFLWLATVVTLLHLWINDGAVSDLLRIAYFGRTVELFVLAGVLGGLFVRLGSAQGSPAALRALHLAAAANALWLAYQVVTGDIGTLFGEVGDSIESYGPKLVGEPSAFGTGAFWTFIAALSVAERTTGVARARFAWALMVAALAGVYFSQSRINLGLVLVLALLLLAANEGPRRRIRIDVGAVFFAGMTAAIVVLLFGSQIAGRATPEALASGLGVRVDGIWGPLLGVLSDNLLIGVGPGGLSAPDMPRDEAHNVALRAALDFGVVTGALLLVALVVFAVAGRRASRDSASVETRWTGLFAALVIACTLATGMVQDALTAVTSTHLMMIAVGLHMGARPLQD
ncbi:hypothetical protein BJF81_14220 [Ornithinimicrobium sp. CNJ-824]|uniref:hypothetical protein n=1 Tax=Ornithinimicrobium sp. CNJ-824 TaxID=1904966 RepID=UPI000969D6DC|nr:hypothetical protein [Ornithinimicrobium sp. CNJ-824]OLT21991.1 hypothetical protein BJF81_14220 [Ornithinimicrobium sp. CNJ-824]